MPTQRFSLRPHPLLRLALYYLALGVVTTLLWIALPDAWEAALRTALGPLLGTSPAPPEGSGNVFVTAQPAVNSLAPMYVALMTLVAGVSAFALALPVSWVYMFTRQRKGYSQSVVQTLVLMPVVIAVVAALVRNSLTLAFSLAGILTAVRFRTNLDDSKDAVFMFVVTALGLACGIQLEIAGVLSVLFVVITLGLWFTDFARVPPALEGAMADRRMARAMAMANRTSQFVAQLDHDVIEGMAPAQLDSLATRIEARKRALVSNESADDGPRFDGRLKVTVADADVSLPVVEAILQAHLKKWQQVRIDRREADADLVFAVRVKKGHTLAQLQESVASEGAPHVISTEVGAWL